MSLLQDQIAKTLLPGMYIPSALELLFAWIEDNQFFIDSADQRLGFLFPPDQLRAGWTDRERPGGTDIMFFAEGSVNLKYWFGHDRPEVINRLCVFARTGDDGSSAAFWLDEHGQQKIVHLGSGSGSVLCCVLADEPIDFLRLLAIGYDEICWHEVYSDPPNANAHNGGYFVHPNTTYQDWVKATFSVTIPQTALEIVKHPAQIGDANSPDPFCRWVELNG